MNGSAMATGVALPEARAEARITRRREIHLGDRVFFYTLKLLSLGVVGLLVAMVIVLFVMAWPALSQFGSKFLTSSEWNSWTQDFGALALVHGTLVISAIALLLAVPVGIGVALFLNELSPSWLAKPLGFGVEMLAAIPSIVYGLWGVFVLAPWLRNYLQPFLGTYFGWIPLFQGPQMGVGLLCAGVVLAIMITPTIAAISREVFRAIPNMHREAALAIGATRWEMIRLAVLKTGFSGMIGAVILGLGRALGETMAVTMVIGNRVEISSSLFAAGQSMASILANQYAEADNDLHLSALAAVGLVLLLLSLLINGTARAVVWRVESKFGQST